MTTTRPERLSPELVAEVQSWLDQDPDEATRFAQTTDPLVIMERLNRTIVEEA